MALNIKDPETERLAAEVAAAMHTTKTGAVRDTLRERKDRLDFDAGQRHATLLRFMDEEICPQSIAVWYPAGRTPVPDSEGAASSLDGGLGDHALGVSARELATHRVVRSAPTTRAPGRGSGWPALFGAVGRV